ncbi:MAG: DUF4407 domain-containing protein [Actinomycetota bacterium]|nr:DUF4407 domain-containing protein [Actinomycetota bacterium]
MNREPEFGGAGPTDRTDGAVVEANDVDVYKAKPEVVIDGRSGQGPALDVPATLAGFAAALGSLLFLGGIISAIVGVIGYQMGLGGNRDGLSLTGLVGGLISLGIAFFIGGWVAARIARHHGTRHGLMTVLWMVVLAAIFAALGAWFGAEYDVLSKLNAPQFFTSDALTIGAIISGLVALAAMLLGAYLGGRMGESSSRVGEAQLVETRKGVDAREGGILQRRREGGRL